MNLSPFPKLMSLMLEAYPCSHFCPQGKDSINMASKVSSNTCPEAIWHPQNGNIPRGFLGATGKAEEVEVIMLFAEPGEPHGNESYGPNLDPKSLMESCINHTYTSMNNGTDQFHRNVKWFLNELFPGRSLVEQLRHVWLTEGRLCSIAEEIGKAPNRICANHFLKRQIELMPNATVIPFGKKARDALKSIKFQYIEGIYALARPGANHKPAKPSWEKAIEIVKSKRT